MTPEPTINELIQAGFISIKGQADKNVDDVRGSDYESLLGPCAVIWSREAQRDTDLFDAVNFNTAEGDVLTTMALQRFGKVRVLDTRGVGTATIERVSGGIAETIWNGTCLLVVGGNAKVYRVTADTAVGSGDLTVVLPIEAYEYGLGQAVVITDPTGLQVQLADETVDPTWKVTALTCADGTVFEEASAFRTRIRAERTAARVGQRQSIIDTCKAAGAVQVAVFRSDYAGDTYDHGLNVCYVGDSGYTGTPELVEACARALRGVRVAGDHLQVLPMAPASLDVTADVYVMGSPGKYDLDALESLHTASLTQYMNGPGGSFTYTLFGLLGALIRNSPEVNRVVISLPSSDAVIVEGADKNFPAILNRYFLNDVNLTYLPG